MPHPLRLLLALFAAAAVVPLPAVQAATWQVDATISDDRQVEDKAGEETTTNTFEQNYTISYSVDINPALSLTVDFALDVTDERNDNPRGEDDFDTRDISPSVNVGLQAAWWDLTANWDYNYQTSDERDEKTARDTTYDLEFNAEPESDAVPTMRLSFQRDRNEEGSQTLTVDTTYEASVDYSFWDLLEITADAQKTRQRSIDSIQVENSVTGAVVEEIDGISNERSYQLDVSLDREILDNLTFDAAWNIERTQSLEYPDETFLDSSPPIIAGDTEGEFGSRSDTQSNNLRAQLSYVVLDDFDLSLGREINWEKDMAEDHTETTDTWTGDAAYTRSLTDTIDIDLSFGEERKETEGTSSDSLSITRDYAAALDFSPLQNITLSSSFDRSDKSEELSDPEPDEARSDDSTDDTYEISVDAAFWDDRVTFTVTRSWNRTEENGEDSAKNRQWDFEATLTPDTLPNLEISPRYTFNEDEDELADTSDREKKVEVTLNYEISLGDVLIMSLDHTYTRTENLPAEGIDSIDRQDDTTITATWDDFLQGMSLEGTMNRQASDTSEDDEASVTDYSYSLTYDYEFLSNYVLSFEYGYDDKQESEDSRNVQATFSADVLEGLFTLDLEYEFDEQLGGEEDKTYRYLIEVSGQF